jgi:16S rRNA (cytosine967-C5)-methyltransferase
MAKRKNVRELASSILMQTYFHGKKAAALLRASTGKLSDERDRRLLPEMVNGVLKRTRTLDAALNTVLSKPVRKLEKPVQVALRLGLFQMLFLDRVPARAAVDESVKIVKRNKPRAAGLVNAVLRKLGDKIEETGRGEFIKSLIEDEILSETERLGIEYSYSDFFVQQLMEAVEENDSRLDKITQILAAGNEAAYITLRVNLMRATRDELSTALAKAGVSSEPGGKREVLHLLGPVNVTTLPGFTEGMFMVPRMGELEANLFRMGATQVRAISADAKKFCAENTGGFDRVLVDAPCSNSGVLRRRPEARLRLEYNTVRALADKALSLLDTAAAAVRFGGILVYSTCSILPMENRQVVDAFLNGHASFSLDAEETFFPRPDGPDGGYMARLKRSSDIAGG